MYRHRPSRPYQADARTGKDGRRMHGGALLGHDASPHGADVSERIRLVRPGQDWRAIPYDLLQPSMQRAGRSAHTSRYRRME